MPRGPAPDHERRLLIAKLRARGLSCRLIGQQLGVSRQCIHALSKGAAAPGIKCKKCGREIAPWRGVARNMRQVYCLACLPDDATFGERLRAYRVAARLTQAELAARVGVALSTIYYWERDRFRPLVRLCCPLGPRGIRHAAARPRR